MTGYTPDHFLKKMEKIQSPGEFKSTLLEAIAEDWKNSSELTKLGVEGCRVLTKGAGIMVVSSIPCYVVFSCMELSDYFFNPSQYNEDWLLKFLIATPVGGLFAQKVSYMKNTINGWNREYADVEKRVIHFVKGETSEEITQSK